MNLTLKIWRQKNANDKGKIVDYPVSGISPDMSFLEMFDVLNQELIEKGEEPVAFDHDCREGICGTCSLYINGSAHGPQTLKLQPVSCICVALKMVILFILSHGELRHSQ
jgi:succinate dehydrogenase / fumarate reductase iron-sulfur subunit